MIELRKIAPLISLGVFLFVTTVNDSLAASDFAVGKKARDCLLYTSDAADE